MKKQILLPFSYEELNNVVNTLSEDNFYLFPSEIKNECHKRYGIDINIAKVRAITSLLYSFFGEKLSKSEFDEVKGRSIKFVTEMQENYFKPVFEKNKKQIEDWIQYSDRYDDIEKRLKKLEELVLKS